MNSRSLVTIQWVIIGILIFAYFTKQNDCPPVQLPPASRHIEVVEGKDTTREQTVPAVKAPKKYKDFLVAPKPNVATLDSSVVDSGYIYLANLSDSSISIDVAIPVNNCSVDSVQIKYTTKTASTIHITDSIPYPIYLPSSTKQLYLGIFANAVTDITAGAQVGYIRGNKLWSYGYDPFDKSHRVGLMWGIR